MSMMKRFLEDLSVVIGGDGEINQAVLDIGNDLMELAERHNLHFAVDGNSLRIILQGGRELTHTEAADRVTEVANKIGPGELPIDSEDKIDLVVLADMLREGSLRQASDYANRMETGCRERIPHEVWRLLISYRTYEPKNPC